MKNNDEFKDIISVLKIITPHSKKFDNFLLSEYSSNKFKFRELIKQLNNIISNQKSSKNRNLITNINDAILKKLEEFLLSTENKNLTTNDIINKIIEITAEIENKKEREITEKKNKEKEDEKQKEENRRKLEEEEKKIDEKNEKEKEEEKKLQTEKEEKEKQEREKKAKEQIEKEEKEKKEKEEKDKKERLDKEEKEKKEKEEKDKENKLDKDKKEENNKIQKENKIKNILEQHNIKINTKDEKFADKILNNKEKIKTAKETFTKFNIQNEQQANEKIDLLNQKINSLKMALSGVKNSAVTNIIMTEINNLSSQINELKNAVSTIIDNEISR